MHWRDFTAGQLCMQAASEDELRYALGLTSLTTGKGKVDLKESNMRPIEVFMCSVVRPQASSMPISPKG